MILWRNFSNCLTFSILHLGICVYWARRSSGRMSICECVSTYICMYIDILREHMCMDMIVNIQVYRYNCVYMFWHISSTGTYTYISIHAWKICIYVYMYICLCIHMYICMFVCVCEYVWTYIQMHTHEYTLTSSETPHTHKWKKLHRDVEQLTSDAQSQIDGACLCIILAHHVFVFWHHKYTLTVSAKIL